MSTTETNNTLTTALDTTLTTTCYEPQVFNHIELKSTSRLVGKFKVWYPAYIDEPAHSDCYSLMLGQLVEHFSDIDATLKSIMNKQFRMSNYLCVVKYGSPYMPEIVFQVFDSQGQYVEQKILYLPEVQEWLN